MKSFLYRLITMLTMQVVGTSVPAYGWPGCGAPMYDFEISGEPPTLTFAARVRSDGVPIHGISIVELDSNNRFVQTMWLIRHKTDSEILV